MTTRVTNDSSPLPDDSVPPAAAVEISVDDLRRLARLVEENGLSELRYAEGDLRITLRTAAFYGASAAGAAPPASQQAIELTAPLDAAFPSPYAAENAAPAASAPSPSHLAAGADDLIRIDAPVMGVFYRSAKPGEPSLVEVGDTVEVGQAVGLIEAMKVFSEVLSEAHGRVREIPARNGALVHPGDPLVVLEAASA